MKRLFLPILVTLSMFTVSCDKDSVTILMMFPFPLPRVN